jgi:hypothetical protein
MTRNLFIKFLISSMAFLTFIFGQSPIRDVDWDINEDNEMVITYDLSPENLEDVYKISVSVTYDGGRNWFSPRSIRGDLGKQKKGYRNKEIIWDIFSDVDELEGDVDVEVVAKLHRTMMQRLTVSKKEKKEKFDGINIYLIAPMIDFDNPTFSNRKDDGVLEPTNFPHSGGLGMNFMYPPLTMDLHFSASSFASKDSLPYMDDYYGTLDYREFDTSQVYHTSTAFYLSHTFLPNIPVVMPSLGLGFQVSALNMIGNYGDKYAKAYTSDLFYVVNVSMASDYAFYQLSYKHSLTRKLRSWSEIQLILGVHL